MGASWSPVLPRPGYVERRLAAGDRSVTTDVLRPPVLGPVDVVVTEIPRFALFDALSATPAVDQSGVDVGREALANDLVAVSVATLVGLLHPDFR